jgi:outer membrane protein insertion porin family
MADPNYKNSGNEVISAFTVSSTDRAASSGFKSSKTGFELGTIFEQYEDIFLSPAILLAFEDIESDAAASSGIKKMDGSYFNVDLEYGISFDKRNRTFRPTKGYKTRFIQSLPIVQDKSSIANTLEVATYYEFSEDVIGSLKFYGKTVTGVDEDVRLTERLYLPRNRLRGFNTYKTGPKDGNDYIGGNYATSINVEAQLPNLLPETYKTDFGLFLDTANIWGVDYGGSINDTNELRSSVGINANVFTAIGPMSFTLAQDLAKAATDETESFNFRLGTSF